MPRGRALGYTLNLPEEDRYLKTREELIDYMTMLLGGRAAEQLVFGAVTTGASDDYKRVAAIAARDGRTSTRWARRELGASPDGDVRLSETTLRLRDEERQDLAERRLPRRAAAAEAHRRWLDALAEELLEQEVLERDGDRPRSWTACRAWSARRASALRVAAAAHNAADRAPTPADAPAAPRRL